MKPKFIPYGRQEIIQADIDAVVNVLQSDFLTQGPVVPKFETEIAEYCGAKHAVAVNSATSALHIACLALGVGQGDIVWTSAITFVASSNCALYCGAKIDFVDIDPLTYNLSTLALAEKLFEAEKAGNLPKVVIPVHLCGQSCNMEDIYALSQKYGFKIIEDASHAIGGKYQGKSVGNCKYSDITVFSFHPVKIITTAEGGVASTNDALLDKKLRLYRSHGVSGDKDDMKERPREEIWNYQQVDLGFNYRMTDLQAALGSSQMKRIDEFVTKRNIIAKRYNQLLDDLPLQLPRQHPESYSSVHLYVIRIKHGETRKTQRQIYDGLNEGNIRANLHYIPVYLHPYYEKLGFNRGYCPNAELYYSEAISIPVFPALKEDDQDRVVDILTTLIGT